MRGIQAVFAGLSALGVLLIVTGMLVDNDAYWALSDPLTITIFAASAVMFGINFKMYGRAAGGA